MTKFTDRKFLIAGPMGSGKTKLINSLSGNVVWVHPQHDCGSIFFPARFHVEADVIAMPVSSNRDATIALSVAHKIMNGPFMVETKGKEPITMEFKGTFYIECLDDMGLISRFLQPGWTIKIL